MNSKQFAVYDSGNVQVYTRIKTGRRLNGMVDLQSLGGVEEGNDVVNIDVVFKESGQLVRGLRHGKWKTEHFIAQNDYLETYRLGVLHGPFVALDAAGRPLYRTTFINGTGYFKRYHSTGQVAYEVLYLRNQLHGWAYAYAPDGRLTVEALYQNGQLVRTVRHRPTN